METMDQKSIISICNIEDYSKVAVSPSTNYVVFETISKTAKEQRNVKIFRYVKTQKTWKLAKTLNLKYIYEKQKVEKLEWVINSEGKELILLVHNYHVEYVGDKDMHYRPTVSLINPSLKKSNAFIGSFQVNNTNKNQYTCFYRDILYFTAFDRISTFNYQKPKDEYNKIEYFYPNDECDCVTSFKIQEGKRSILIANTNDNGLWAFDLKTGGEAIYVK